MTDNPCDLETAQAELAMMEGTAFTSREERLQEHLTALIAEVVALRARVTVERAMANMHKQAEDRAVQMAEATEALNRDMREALEHAEDILGFQEGSEEKQTPEGRPVIWINAQGPDGDFQIMLAKIRAVLKKATP